MRPILFPESATQFNTNGLGRLDCISCVVVEERNGEYTLSMEIAETTLHAKEIQLSMIIVAKPSDGATLQAFRVYKITKPLGGKFTVLAQHISYQLSYIPTMPFTVTADTNACATVLSRLKSNAVESCPFNFSTDVHTVASYKQTVPASIRSRLGGVEGSVLDQFGGEYEWNNYNVILHKNRGVTVPNVSLRYGKNIIDINQETQIESTITGIVPYWLSTDGETMVTLPERVVNGAHASAFPFKRTVPMDFSQDFQEEPTVVQLRTKAQAYVNASGIGIPAVSIKLSFINLADTEEYKNLAAFQTVKLCDNVEVYFEKLGIATTAQIVRTEYDVLLERYNSVEIGSLRSTLSGVISSTEGAIAQVANDTRRMFSNISTEIQSDIDNATKWLTGSNGYVVAVKNTDGTWKELLFMSEPDLSSRTANVLRINENGMGFSSTGAAGPYTQGWTLDGKMLIGGTNVPSLTVYENPDASTEAGKGKVLFRINKNGIEWHAKNSDLDTLGQLTVKDDNGTTLGTWNSSGITVYKGSIEGTSLKVGGYNNKDGTITVMGADNTTVLGTWDNNGIDVKSGTVTGATIQTKAAKNGSSNNYRIVMDTSSSIKGVVGDAVSNPTNFIDMAQPKTNTTEMTIGFNDKLNIMGPYLGVATSKTASTANETLTDGTSNGGRRISNVRKCYLNSSGDPSLDDEYNQNNRLNLKEGNYAICDPSTGQIIDSCYATLPAILVCEGYDEQRIHGMVLSNRTWNPHVETDPS